MRVWCRSGRSLLAEELLDGEMVLRVAIRELTSRTVAGIWPWGGMFSEWRSVYMWRYICIYMSKSRTSSSCTPFDAHCGKLASVFPGGEDRYLRYLRAWVDVIDHHSGSWISRAAEPARQLCLGYRAWRCRVALTDGTAELLSRSLA